MIRRFKEADADAVVEIWFAASSVATPFLPQDFLRRERKTIREVWLQEAETWVWEEDGRVAGFLSLIGNEVGGLFVDPDRQGRGIGRALMDHAVDRRGDLVLDVFEDNTTARRFYDRYGFRVEQRHLHGPGGFPQLRMTYRARG